MADTGPAVGTASPSGGDYRGGEVRCVCGYRRYYPERCRCSPVKARSDRVRNRNRCSVAVASFLLMAGLFFSTTTPAWCRPPVPANVFWAVRAFWKTKAERVEAFNIVACETGNRYNTTAQNGQYLGLFQMGSFARARYGHSWTAWGQARAAHRYYLVAGWSPWSCA